MKKIVFILCLVFIANLTVKAQKMDFGIKAGYLYSNVEAKDIESFQSIKNRGKNGYMFGVFGRIGGDKWFFQPAIEYRVRTADIVSGKEIWTNQLKKKSELSVSLKTIDIPLQLGISLLNASVVKLYAHTGPVVSFKIDNKTTAKDVIDNFKFDDYNDYKSFIWSGQIGLSADIMRFTVDVTYEKGFSDISDKGMGKNDLVMATLGVKLF